MPLLRSCAATPEANTERTFSDSFVKAIASIERTTESLFSASVNNRD